MRQKALPKPPHGNCIYAYCHVKTNQVLYSLERTLRPRALKQLPDIGANLTPPTLRKDVWKPLFSVHLPDTDLGRRQGIQALKMLREYRMLHETNWEPPLELSMNYTEKQRKALKERLEQRGGSKKERVEDLIKREKKKLRQKIIMNQKANSIADLAAVLLQQGDSGTALARKRSTEADTKRKKEVQDMLRMAEKYGSFEEIDEEEKGLLKAAQDNPELSKTRSKERRKEISLQFDKIRFGKAAVSWVDLPMLEREREVRFWEEFASLNPENLSDEDRKSFNIRKNKVDGLRQHGYGTEEITILAKAEGWGPEPEPEVMAAPEAEVGAVDNGVTNTETTNTGASRIETRSYNATARTLEAAEATSVPKPDPINYAEVLPSFPSRFNPLSTPLSKLKKSSPLRQEIERRQNDALYSTEGITVRWANILDAEFAEMWPEAVEHERMGAVRHEHPSVPGVDDVSAFKALQWKHRKEKWELEPDTAQRVQEIRAQMGLIQEPNRSTRLIEKGKLGAFVRQRLEAAQQGQLQFGHEVVDDAAAQAELYSSPETAEPEDTVAQRRLEYEAASGETQEESYTELDEASIIEQATNERKAYLENLLNETLEDVTRPKWVREQMSRKSQGTEGQSIDVVASQAREKSGQSASV